MKLSMDWWRWRRRIEVGLGWVYSANESPSLTWTETWTY